MMDNSKQLSMLLQMLQESLVQKNDILTKIEAKSKAQAELIAKPDVTLEELDRNMDEKAALIARITKLDSGFESLYDNIRKDLLGHKDEYKEQIAQIQKLIEKVMEKSASIEALEARNKTAIETMLRQQKKDLQHQKNASSVARHYYKATNKLNYVNPQFLDQKF